MLHRRTAILTCLLIGVALHISVWQVSGAREPWDDPVYWRFGIPLAALAAGCVGYLSRGQDWLATLLIVPAQVATMMLKSGEVGNLWPLSFALGVAMSLPFTLVAFIASRFRPSGRRQ